MALVQAARKRPMIITDTLDMMPFEMTAQEFLERFNSKPHTKRAYQTDIKLLIDNIEGSAGKAIVGDFNRSSVENFIAEESERVSASTLDRRIGCYKSLSNHISVTYSTLDRLRDVKLPKRPSRTSFKALTEGEYSRLLDVVSKATVEHRAMVLLMLMTGLRVSEVRDLTLRNLSEDLSSLVNVKGKGDKFREMPLPIPPLLRASLGELLERRRRLTDPRYPLFVSIRGYKQRDFDSAKFNGKSIYLIVRALCQKAGIRSGVARPHTLRHTYAVRAAKYLSAQYDSVTATNLVRKLLGHSHLSTTQIYFTHDNAKLISVMEGFK